MMRLLLLISFSLLLVSCTPAPVHNDPITAAEQATTSAGVDATGAAPAGKSKKYRPGGPQWRSKGKIRAKGPFPIDLASVPPGVFDPFNKVDRGWKGKRMDSAVPRAEANRLRAVARNLPVAPELVAAQSTTGGQAPTSTGTSFEGLDVDDCCGGGASVPPDPELAVGPNHVVAVVNSAFKIFDKHGTLLTGPITFSSFFNGTPGCSSQAVFDPNVLYDEEHDRFILGIDGDGGDYCVAASQTGDPTGQWYRYGFATNIGNNFFDFPHVGVGNDAIYMGANMFGAQFVEARVWAMDKIAMYNGQSMAVVNHSTGDRGTPQPMNLHGFSQGTWPVTGPHYIVTNENFNGRTYSIWKWDDPFGADSFTRLGSVDLAAMHGVTVGMPVDVPQLGGQDLQANDFRPTHAEYRDGKIWFAAGVSCNPGSGTVNCVQWGQLDPAGPTLLDAGIHGTDDEYRFFPDLAVDACGNMAIGYTRSSVNSNPSVYVNGDSGGGIETDTLLKAGEASYYDWLNPPDRWGDYTGMTIDPDGTTFWYLGEYSKANVTSSLANWSTYIGSFSYGCNTTPVAPGLPSNPLPADSSSGVGVEASLSWTAGSSATSHDVYFGTNPTPDASEFQGNQSGVSFDPGTLALNTTYYWRVDEVNAQGTTSGPVWSFTTESVPSVNSVCVGDIQMALVNLKKNRRADATISVTDCAGSPVAGATVNGEWEYPASSGPQSAPNENTNTSGVAVSSSPAVRKSQSGRFAYYVLNVINPGMTYDAGNSVKTGCINTDGSSCSVEPPAPPTQPPGPASSPTPADGATDAAVDTALNWGEGADVESHDVYFGTDSSPDNGGADGQTEFQGNQTGTSYDPGPLAHNTTYYWRIDEVNAQGTTTGKVWNFATAVPPPAAGEASNPAPGSGSKDVPVDILLKWTPGPNMANQKVYFGLSNEPPWLGDTTGSSINPGALANSATYNWRVDTLNSAGEVTPGLLWSFTTVVAPAADAVNITRATYENGPRRLTVWATSSQQPNVTLTLEGYGQMSYNASAGRYEYSARKVNNPGTVTVNSSGGGTASTGVQ